MSDKPNQVLKVLPDQLETLRGYHKRRDELAFRLGNAHLERVKIIQVYKIKINSVTGTLLETKVLGELGASIYKLDKLIEGMIKDIDDLVTQQTQFGSLVLEGIGIDVNDPSETYQIEMEGGVVQRLVVGAWMDVIEPAMKKLGN